MTPEEEKLQLLGVIQANRHKLSSDEQQMFDQIVQRVGPVKVPGTVANTAAARLAGMKNSTIVDTRPPIGSDISLGDMFKAAGRGTVNVVKGIGGLVSPPTGDVVDEIAGKVLEGEKKYPGRVGTMQGVISAFPVLGGTAARLTDPTAAYATGRAPSRDENLGVAEATGELGTIAAGGKLASDMPAARAQFKRSPPPTRLPLPDVWEGGDPSGTLPVYGEPVSTPPTKPARALEYLVREAASKIPAVGTRVSDAVKGSIARPRTNTPRIGTVDLSRPAAYGSARLEPIRPRSTSEFDPRNPTVFRGSTEDTSLSPPPVNEDFAYGDAPVQPLNPFKPRTVGPNFDPRAPGGKFAPRASIPLATDASTAATKPAGVAVMTPKGEGVSTHQFTNKRTGQLMHRVRMKDGTTTVVPVAARTTPGTPSSAGGGGMASKQVRHKIMDPG